MRTSISTRYTALHDFGVSGSSHARPRTTARGLINSGDKEQRTTLRTARFEGSRL